VQPRKCIGVANYLKLFFEFDGAGRMNAGKINFENFRKKFKRAFLFLG
jgi:hypothetical protein